MAISLTPRQQALLKARAHLLEPVVKIGQAGLTEAVRAEVDRSLTAHGLIKVRLGAGDRGARAELSTALSEQTESAAVQMVGRILVLWRPRPDDKPLDTGTTR